MRPRTSTPTPAARSGPRPSLRATSAAEASPTSRACPTSPSRPARHSPGSTHWSCRGEATRSSFFGYAGQPSRLVREGCEIPTLSGRTMTPTPRSKRWPTRSARRARSEHRDARAARPRAGTLDRGGSAAARRAPARRRDRRGRGRDLGPTWAAPPPAPRRTRARADRRRDRPGPAVRRRRRPRLPRAAGDRVPGRRQRPLHVPGALDAWRARGST